MNKLYILYLLLSYIILIFGVVNSHVIDPTPNTVYVDLKSECVENCGSIENPFIDIKSAVEYLKVLPNVYKETSRIYVNPGYYKGSRNKEVNFDFPAFIRSVSGSKITTIDCGNISAGFNFKNGTVFQLSGFTFAYCKSSKGGAMTINEGSSGVISDVVFYQTQADIGGALYISDVQKLKIASVVFFDTTASELGTNSIYAENSNIHISTSHFKRKQVKNEIHLKKSTITFDKSSYTEGLGIECTDGSLTSQEGITGTICNTPTVGTGRDLNLPVLTNPYNSNVTGTECVKDGKCDSFLGENCLNCPDDCKSCKFGGWRLSTTGTPKVSTMISSINSYKTHLYTISYEMSNYIRVPSDGSYTFKLEAENVGVKLIIDGTNTIVSSYFDQKNVNTIKTVRLSSNIPHFIQLFFKGSNPNEKSISLLWKQGSSEDSSFGEISGFYSMNVCDDGILDPLEDLDETKVPPVPVDSALYCENDRTLSFSHNKTRCGDGVCTENPETFNKAKEVQNEREGTIVASSVDCEFAKATIKEFKFHPNFIKDLAKATNEADMRKVINTYGHLYYKSAVLGGSLKQITYVNRNFFSSSTDTEAHTDYTFAASVSGGVGKIGPSIDIDYEQSGDNRFTQEEQSKFEQQSERTSVMAFGGVPGAMGPSATNSWQEWANNIDLFPVPIKKQFGLIANIIPETWRTTDNSRSIRDLWIETGMKMLVETYNAIPTSRKPASVKAHFISGFTQYRGHYLRYDGATPTLPMKFYSSAGQVLSLTKFRNDDELPKVGEIVKAEFLVPPNEFAMVEVPTSRAYFFDKTSTRLDNGNYSVVNLPGATLSLIGIFRTSCDSIAFCGHVRIRFTFYSGVDSVSKIMSMGDIFSTFPYQEDMALRLQFPTNRRFGIVDRLKVELLDTYNSKLDTSIYFTTNIIYLIQTCPTHSETDPDYSGCVPQHAATQSVDLLSHAILFPDNNKYLN
eukprot:gene11150-13660_t